jgi:hypothetical protein
LNGVVELTFDVSGWQESTGLKSIWVPRRSREVFDSKSISHSPFSIRAADPTIYLGPHRPIILLL